MKQTFALPISFVLLTTALAFDSFANDREPNRNTLPGYRLELDVPYADNDNPRQRLDLYLPTNAGKQPRPLLVFVHGGAWLGGNKKGGLGQLRPFLEGDFIGASIGYRLSDEAIWPAQIHDCKAAIRWLRANADQYGIDPNRIVAFGTSAGGHLVAMLGVSGEVAALKGTLGKHLQESSRVSAVIDFFGPSDLLSMGVSPAFDHDAPTSPESKLVGGTLQDHPEIAKSASPTSYVTQDDASFLIVHGDRDRLVPFQQSVLLHDKLRKTGVDAIMIRMDGGGHGFRHADLQDRMKLFIRQAFGMTDADVTVSEEPIQVRNQPRR